MMLQPLMAGDVPPSVYTPNLNMRDTHLAGIGGTASVDFTFYNTGAGQTTGFNVSTPGSFTWLLIGAASDYELYVTNAGLGTISGTLNTWISLGTTRAYSMTESNNDSSANGTYQIRRASDSVVLSTGTWSTEVATAP
jgi:hypothetical protein